ncbi:MAG: alpha-amylase family glycosyl hydrolase [Planctomycetota bacterium]
MPSSIDARPNGSGNFSCRFRFENPTAQSVSLVGTFNGWNPTAHKLSNNGKGIWTVFVEIPPGIWHYKFVVDGGEWRFDPANPERLADGFQGYNSVLKLGGLARLAESPARKGDERIHTIGLRHDPESTRYRQRVGEGAIVLRYRTLAGDVDQVQVAFRQGSRVPMKVVHSDEMFETYEASVQLDALEKAPGADPNATPFEYTFVLVDGDEQRCHHGTFVLESSGSPLLTTPEWARHAVWYQIMLERFRDGDPSNNPQPCRNWKSEWSRRAGWEESGRRFNPHRRHYGGDLAGLENRLPYLSSLGVNAIYLNPIFKARSHHKYDAINYLHVDDHFGTRGDYERIAATEDLMDPTTWRWTDTDHRFLNLLKRAHKRGIRIVLDGVFNHVGTHHPAFLDVRQNRQSSRYADWFDVTSWDPFRYSGWAGHGALPIFKKSESGFASEAVKRHVFDVTTNEVPQPFWIEWRQLVKEINPDALIIGEIWGPAESWLDGSQFDSVMNYPFAEAVLAWVCNRQRKITVSELDRRLARLRLAYPAAATYCLQNLVGSHDTDRLVSMAHNPDRDYDRMNRSGRDSDYDNTKPPEAAYRRARLVALLQMTYVGAPMIYYGDEVGMWGADDPECRKPMLWSDLGPYDAPGQNSVMEDHLAWYRRLIAIRRQHGSLRTGSFETLLINDDADTWVFLRRSDDDQVLVVVNASDEARRVAVTLPAYTARSWRNLLIDNPVEPGGGGRLTAVQNVVTIDVPAVGGAILAGTPLNKAAERN